VVGQHGCGGEAHIADPRAASRFEVLHCGDWDPAVVRFLRLRLRIVSWLSGLGMGGLELAALNQKLLFTYYVTLAA